jgi:hypothetical protein
MAEAGELSIPFDGELSFLQKEERNVLLDQDSGEQA